MMGYTAAIKGYDRLGSRSFEDLKSVYLHEGTRLSFEKLQDFFEDTNNKTNLRWCYARVINTAYYSNMSFQENRRAILGFYYTALTVSGKSPYALICEMRGEKGWFQQLNEEECKFYARSVRLWDSRKVTKGMMSELKKAAYDKEMMQTTRATLHLKI